MAAGEVELIYLFSGLLAFGAVFLAFVPALHHAWTFAASRRTFAILLTGILGIGLAAVLFVTYAFSDPLDFLPIALITVGLRSPLRFSSIAGCRIDLRPSVGGVPVDGSSGSSSF